jgi:hypothetical protein
MYALYSSCQHPALLEGPCQVPAWLMCDANHNRWARENSAAHRLRSCVTNDQGQNPTIFIIVLLTYSIWRSWPAAFTETTACSRYREQAQAACRIYCPSGLRQGNRRQFSLHPWMRRLQYFKDFTYLLLPTCCKQDLLNLYKYRVLSCFG